MASDRREEASSEDERRPAARAESSWAQAGALAHAGRLKLNWDCLLDVAPPPLPTGIDLADKVEGMLLGLAVGDALGNTSESMNPADRQARHGWISGYLSNRYADYRAVGLASDDTQMAFWTLEQMLADGGLDPVCLGSVFCSRKIYGIGQSVKRFQRNRQAGGQWFEWGEPSAGNGALMRIAPVLLPHLRTPSRNLWGDTLIAAHLTHDDLLSNSSCVAMVSMLWQLLGMHLAPEKRWWIDTWLATCEPLTAGRPDGQFKPRTDYPRNFRGCMEDMVTQHVRPALDQDLAVAAAGDIWHSGAYLLETVPAVLYVLSRHGHDPVEAILQAVNHTRDNDTCAAIVGAAVGALHGANALPEAWIDGLLGRTGADDDGQVFRLLAQAGDRYGHGVSSRVRSRAAAAHTREV
jgi:ADP-ribosyl-[dinitrogen reductase] hydrolase